MVIHVELLVDHSNDSVEARRLLYELDRKYPQIDVEGIPANGHDLPKAFCYGFTYRGIDRIKSLEERLIREINEGKIN